ncbi:phosphotriesterase family protein [Psychrobacillus sp. BM2]|uniref:phosphotriesterase family protein n=1 Tax=Psychrobacillus sp. BM2 TaxID=3400421 RepID=UPI003B01B3DC
MRERMVTTVKGDIRPEEMGITHAHEHLFIKPGHPAKQDPALCIDDFELTMKELAEIQILGVQTIIDAQPVGSGRNARWLTEVAEQSGLNILASTGFHKLSFYPNDHWIRTKGSEQLAELFINELTEGMFADGEGDWPSEQLPARAGLIKTATDMQGTAGRYFDLFRAAAKAALTTGSPIMSHTELGYHALEQVALYESLGVPAEQLIICHLDRKMENADYMLHVASTGVFLELDTIGRFHYHSDEEEIELIHRLLDAGHEDQILLSLDTTRKRMKFYDGGSFGMDHLLAHFIPMLKHAGVTEEIIQKMLVSNPAKAFAKR